MADGAARVQERWVSWTCWHGGVVIDLHEWSNDGAALVGRDAAAAQALEARRAELRKQLDGRLFERDDLAWYRGAFLEAFLFMYDTSFYDRVARRYRIEEILDDGEREFGGYDFVLLWQSYPRLGIDGRNQLDLYRDMPGGLPGLRDLVRRAHGRGVRVFVNYNPWDVGTGREPDRQGDGEALAGIIEAIGADGVFLDTMTMDEPGFREPLERANPSIVFNPEGIPPVSALSSVAGSWMQRRAVAPPGLLTIRWLQPRFSFRAIERTALDRSEVVQKGFFHGCGHVVWENIFGWWNPWSEADRALLRRCTWILASMPAPSRTRTGSPTWRPWPTAYTRIAGRMGRPRCAPCSTRPNRPSTGRCCALPPATRPAARYATTTCGTAASSRRRRPTAAASS